MAIARLQVKVGKAGKAAPHAAYIARSGQFVNRLYSGERLVAKNAGNMPLWAQHDPSRFWQAADAHERANGTTYREMEIALPRELTDAQNIALVRSFVAQEIGDRHAYQWAIHSPRASDGLAQPHVHLMFSERQVDGIDRDEVTYFKRYNAKSPDRGGARKGYGPAAGEKLTADERKEHLKQLRSRWELACNQALAEAGKDIRIDMRSNGDRGGLFGPRPTLTREEWFAGGREKMMARQEAVRAVQAAEARLAAEIPDVSAALVSAQASLAASIIMEKPHERRSRGDEAVRRGQRRSGRSLQDVHSRDVVLPVRSRSAGPGHYEAEPTADRVLQSVRTVTLRQPPEADDNALRGSSANDSRATAVTMPAWQQAQQAFMETGRTLFDTFDEGFMPHSSSFSAAFDRGFMSLPDGPIIEALAAPDVAVQVPIPAWQQAQQAFMETGHTLFDTFDEGFMPHSSSFSAMFDRGFMAEPSMPDRPVPAAAAVVEKAITEPPAMAAEVPPAVQKPLPAILPSRTAQQPPVAPAAALPAAPPLGAPQPAVRTWSPLDETSPERRTLMGSILDMTMAKTRQPQLASQIQPILETAWKALGELAGDLVPRFQAWISAILPRQKDPAARAEITEVSSWRKPIKQLISQFEDEGRLPRSPRPRPPGRGGPEL